MSSLFYYPHFRWTKLKVWRANTKFVTNCICYLRPSGRYSSSHSNCNNDDDNDNNYSFTNIRNINCNETTIQQQQKESFIVVVVVVVTIHSTTWMNKGFHTVEVKVRRFGTIITLPHYRGAFFHQSAEG